MLNDVDDNLVYSSNVVLPNEATTFQARMDITDNRIDPVVINIDATVAPLAMLREENAVINPGETLLVSWQSASETAIANARLEFNRVSVVLEACDGVNSGEVVLFVVTILL